MSLPALNTHKLSKFFSCALMLFAVLVMVSGCDLAANYDKQDREANLETQDYRDLLAARDAEKEVSDFAKSSKIPALKSYVSPVSTNVKSMPLVSISVNQSVPLRDVLFELAKQADYDIELDSNIRGSIIFTARNRPLDVVIARIAEVSGLRYSFEDDVLRVEVDSPYHKTYKIDYLNYIRTNAGSIRNSVAVVSGDGADTGSGFETTTESESDFWGELETNLNQILRSNRASLITSRDPSLTAVAAPEVAGTNDAVLDVASLPIEGAPAVPAATSVSQPAAAALAAGSFAVNRQAGLVSVYGSERAHKEVSEYLTDLRKSMTAQVLIEAKILEVSLTDQFSAGIDWQALQISGGEGVFEFGSAAGTIASAGTIGTSTALTNLATRPAISQAASNNFVVGFLGNDIQALVQAMSGFGTVRALASPRLTVLNNQSAILNVATNRVFFEIDVESETTESGLVSRTVEAEIRNVPEGILVNVQPSINLDTQTVSMAVRPTITRIVSTVQDPSVSLIDASVDAPVPELNVQEIDSVIQVKSGQPVVMGGLLQDRVIGSSEAVPVLGEIPVVGNLFRNKSDSITKTELVILLKATIMQGNNNIDDTDRDLYRAFAQDRRPFKL